MIVDLSLKLVVDFTTRRQTRLKQVEAWTSNLDGWTAAKVDELIASSPVTVSLILSEYGREITDYGEIGTTNERAWQLYPSRLVRFEVDVDDGLALRTHFDTYASDLRLEIQTLLDSERVVHRITVQSWHLHFEAGAVDG